MGIKDKRNRLWHFQQQIKNRLPRPEPRLSLRLRKPSPSSTSTATVRSTDKKSLLSLEMAFPLAATRPPRTPRSRSSLTASTPTVMAKSRRPSGSTSSASYLTPSSRLVLAPSEDALRLSFSTTMPGKNEKERV